MTFLLELFHLLGLRFLPSPFVRFNFLDSDVTNMRSDPGVRPIHAYMRVPLHKQSLNHTKLVRTGDDHPSLGFLDLYQPFLGA